jgi:transcriptional regulator with XRE-family HTH domain
MDPVEIASALTAERKRNCMSQGHLAEAAGVSRSTVQRAERGMPISAENARSICAVLNIDPTRFADFPEEAAVQAPPVEAAPTSLLAQRHWNALGDMAIAMVIALSSVIFWGPYVQKVFASRGWESPAVQTWAQVLLTLMLLVVVVALPIVVLYDERRIMAGRDVRMTATNMMVALTMTGSGGLMFLTMIVPMLLVV